MTAMAASANIDLSGGKAILLLFHHNVLAVGGLIL